MLDLSLAKDFRNEYRRFIEEKTSKLLPTGYDILFDGWVGVFYVVIAESKSGINNAMVCIGNNKNHQKVFKLRLINKHSEQNPDNYKNIYTKDLPPELVLYLSKHRGLTSKFTTFHRFIASCTYKLKDKKVKGKYILEDLFEHKDRYKGSKKINRYNPKLDVHHILPDTERNNIENLIPIESFYHNKVIHKIFATPTEAYSLSWTENEWQWLKMEITKKQGLNKARNRSKDYYDELLYQICFYHYIENVKSTEFGKMLINGKKYPSDRTIRNYLQEFKEFEEFYNQDSQDIECEFNEEY